VSAYKDSNSRRLYLIGSDYDTVTIEPEVPGARRTPVAYTYKGRRLVVADLIEAGFLTPGEPIEYRRAREGKIFPATLTDDGRIRLEDGRVYDSLSRAACVLADIAALPGWEVWTAPERGGKRLFDIRREFLDAVARNPERQEGPPEPR
jgi:hypothetical protein